MGNKDERVQNGCSTQEFRFANLNIDPNTARANKRT